MEYNPKVIVNFDKISLHINKEHIKNIKKTIAEFSNFKFEEKIFNGHMIVIGKFTADDGIVSIVKIFYDFYERTLQCYCNLCNINSGLNNGSGGCIHLKTVLYEFEKTLMHENFDNFGELVFIYEKNLYTTDYDRYTPNYYSYYLDSVNTHIGITLKLNDDVHYLIPVNSYNFLDFFNRIDTEKYFQEDKYNSYRYLKMKELQKSTKGISFRSLIKNFDLSSNCFELIVNKYIINTRFHKSMKYPITSWTDKFYLPINIIDNREYQIGGINDYDEFYFVFSQHDNDDSLFCRKGDKYEVLLVNKEDLTTFHELRIKSFSSTLSLTTFSKYITFFYYINIEKYLHNNTPVPTLDYFVDIKNAKISYDVQLYDSDYNDKNCLTCKIIFKVNGDKYVISNFDETIEWILLIEPVYFYDVKAFVEMFDEKRDDEFIVSELTINKIDEINKVVKRFNRLKKIDVLVDSKYILSLNKKKINFNVNFNQNICKLVFNIDGLTESETSELINKYQTNKTNLLKLSDNKILNIDNFDFADLEKKLNNIGYSTKEVTKKNFTVNRGLLFLLSKSLKNQEIKKFVDKINNYKPTKKIPESLQKILKPHQVEGVNWALKMLDNDFGCLIADEMGVGKTLQAITLLSIYHSVKKTKMQSIIICPLSLVYNWKTEIEQYIPNINAKEVVGTKEERKNIVNDKNNEILIVSFSTLIRDTHLYEGKNFLMAIIDEAQYIKNDSSLNSRAVKDISATYKLALTGTPIENNLIELWSIFDFLVPGLLGDKRSFVKKLDKFNKLDKDNSIIKRIIAPFYLRREKKDVLKFLPDKITKILSADFSKEELEEYNKIREETIAYLLKHGKEMTAFHRQTFMFKMLTKLRMFCCAPKLVDGKNIKSSKLELCMNLVKDIIDNTDDKIIIFSQFTTVLDLIKVELNKLKIKSEMLTGKHSTNQRRSSIEKFSKTKDIRIFLISLKAGGVGLNITSANNVIHYDPWWNIAIENQATDRSHRLGQEKIVTVYKLIINNSIEERIIELQNKKMDLFKGIFSSQDIDQKIDYDFMKKIIDFKD